MPLEVDLLLLGFDQNGMFGYSFDESDLREVSNEQASPHRHEIWKWRCSRSKRIA